MILFLRMNIESQAELWTIVTLVLLYNQRLKELSSNREEQRVEFQQSGKMQIGSILKCTPIRD